MTIGIAIRDKKHIRKIKRAYRKRGRLTELLLFLLIINTGITLRRLLEFKVKNLKNKKEILYKKSRKKSYLISLNKEITDLVDEVIKGKRLSDPVFVSRIGTVIDRTTVNRNFKQLCRDLKLPADYTLTSWRKTFAYHYWLKNTNKLYLLDFFEQNLAHVIKFIGIEKEVDLSFGKSVNL